MNSILAMKTIGVIGSGTDEHIELANALGSLLAWLGGNLLTGGGRGVMTSVSRAFTRSNRACGLCIGIIPCMPENPSVPKKGYPNRYIELAIFTHLPKSGDEGVHPLSRNHINVLSSTAIVALPGGKGTASEVSLALRYRKPLMVYAPESDLVNAFPRNVERAATIQEIEAFLRAHVD